MHEFVTVLMSPGHLLPALAWDLSGQPLLSLCLTPGSSPLLAHGGHPVNFDDSDREKKRRMKGKEGKGRGGEWWENEGRRTLAILPHHV